MVTAEICAIPHNACKSLTTSCAQQKFAQPMPRSQLILLGGLTRPSRSRSATDLVPGIHAAVRSLNLWLRARFKVSRRFLLTGSPALIGASVGAITSTITVGCSGNRGQPDNSQLSPDKYEVLDGFFSAGQAMVSGIP
jgi:hypothetical protein